ncbi:leucine-rich repeat domain-containing protein [Aquimarina muelleri]|uniref:Disease resistance R13L4/SHOC-2-like LRR domain-containing protein n=1 Tax=Aquimarina muelleri TaxID=279356 RepID=A0A918N491_9FLAO|nr:hypothetical protein [Aquimarina muelleri]MCX2764767.1 hypothetical protein [Aquimarina muelleri]GGX33692.1 hypothetical protein GCM10007384_37950 [Aquimarina muelleri]
MNKIFYLIFLLITSINITAQKKSYSLEKALQNPESVESLDLSSQNLTKLPNSIGKLVNLKNLVLSRNHLTKLPETIANLKDLKSLTLDQNKLIELPKNIGYLKSLEYLSAEENQLYKLPKSIGDLEALTMLIVSKNNLTELPESFGNLKKLKFLDVKNCKIKKLPKSIGNCASLEYFNALKNELKVLPESFSNLKHLERLVLTSNQLIKLPKKIGSLTMLNKLELRKNQITELPESFYNLPKIEEFDLTDNKIHIISKNIGNLKSLKSIQLQSNPLTKLPEEIGDLSNLELLWLNKNKLTSLPVSIGKLSNLEKLSAGYMNLKSVPNTITKLQNLKSLKLDKNQLTSLPLAIGDMKKLKNLNVKSNMLTSIPASLGNLKLSSLDIRENLITELPQSVIDMGCFDVHKDKHVYYPSRAELIKKDRERIQNKIKKEETDQSTKEKDNIAELEKIRLQKIKEQEKFRLYHNVLTDELRIKGKELSKLEPFKSNTKYNKIINSLHDKIDRYSVSKHITSLNYIMYISEIPNNYKTKYYLSDREINDFKNISHLSAHALADSYISAKNYQKAIEYLKLALVKFPYHSYSGTTVNKDRLRIRTDLAEIYYEIKNKNDAYVYVLANIINGESFRNHEKILIDYLKGEDKVQFKKDLNAAINTIKIKANKEYEITFRSKKYTFYDGPYKKSLANMKTILLSIKLE